MPTDTIRTPRGLVVLKRHWQLLLRNTQVGQPTLIIGPTGTGKTTLALDAAQALQRPYEVFYCSGMHDAEASTVGTTQLRNGSTRFEPSRFIDAVTTPNSILILDELNRAPGAFANSLLSLLDGSGQLGIDTDDGARRLVTRAAGVSVIATANIGSEYIQTELLDAALENRFLFVRLNYLDEASERMLVEEVGIDRTAAVRLVKAVREIRAAHGRGDLPTAATTRKLLLAASVVRDGFSIEDALEAAVAVVDEADVLKLRSTIRAAA